MKKNKAFTLIELLAIIVILAIIAVITVPIILGIIDNSKKGAAINSAYGYKDAINKYYLSKLSDNDDYRLDGTYEITDGKLNNYEIPISGEKPKSGTLTYSNNILISGCLTFSDYKVYFENGKVKNSEKGTCEVQQETVLYYTYDETAPENHFQSKISQKYPEPDSSWLYYIKETTSTVYKDYVIEFTNTQDGKRYTASRFNTLEQCNETLTNNLSQSDIEETQAICKEENKVTLEACGVNEIEGQEPKRFCIKANDYTNSISTLNSVFSNCEPVESGTNCSGQTISAGAYPGSYGDGRTSFDGAVGVSKKDNSHSCFVLGTINAVCN